MFTKIEGCDVLPGMIVTLDVNDVDNDNHDDVAWHVVSAVDVSDDDVAVVTMRSLQGLFASWNAQVYYDCPLYSRDDFHNFDV